MFTAIHKEISVFAKSGIAHIPCHDGKVITCGECLGRRSVNVQRLGILRLVLRDGQIPDKKNDCGYQDQKNDEDGLKNLFECFVHVKYPLLINVRRCPPQSISTLLYFSIKREAIEPLILGNFT